jgi:6-phosphogluconolactonase
MSSADRFIFRCVVAFVAAGGFAAFGSVSAFAQASANAKSQAHEQEQDEPQDNSPTGPGGAVFAMSNATTGNVIVAYRRALDGTLTRVHSVRTRGLGIGVDTDTQGPLRLSSDHRFLYAVNPGSDDISVFAVDGTRLRFLQKIYAGDQPLALTLHGNLLYVLNGSVAGNGIRGFTVAHDGTLTAIPNSFRDLSSRIAVPGTVQFSPDGHFILVTHKTTNVLLTPQNVIDGFTIGADDLASATPVANASYGIRPFSLAFRDNGKLVVVESYNALDNHSAASSYQTYQDARTSVISASVPNGQTDVCWVVVSKDQQYAFTANFGSGTVSSYRFADSGALSLISGQAASFGAMSQPVDLAQSHDGRFLYQLLRGVGGVAAMRIGGDGSLTPLGITVGGLPVNDGISGLAAY